jgi:hypothetical protein
MTRKILLGIALTGALGILLFRESSGQDPAVVGERSLTIAYMADEMGRIEPCG